MPAVFANNLKLSNFDAVSTDETAKRMTFRFDLAQENSWRNNVNHDAAWIFMKYSTDGGQTWHHATMGGAGVNPAGFSFPVDFEGSVPQDMKGFFVQRTAVGSGSINLSNVKFVWNYAQDGLPTALAKASNTLTRLYGLEMVYIPEGAFFAGDGASASSFRFKQGSGDDEPWYISSENSITTTNTASGGRYYQSSGAPGENPSGAAFLIPNSFPKGEHAFYLMKYELTEGEWVAFFNTLSVAAKNNRDITSNVAGGKGTSAVVNRNTVFWDAANPLLPAGTKRPARAMSYVSWLDAAAYADWACLRPITELEFEKAARGADIHPVVDEYAWGTAVFTSAETIMPDQDEDGSELILGTANLNRNALSWSTGDGRLGGIAQGQKGALRAGIFAANATNRVTAGGGYYGNMELSGNLSEPAVTIGRPEGRQFLGSHGDGELSSLPGFEGNATNVDWPGINAQDARKGVTSTIGIGYRGGDFSSADLNAFKISSRLFAAKDPDSSGFNQRYDAAAGIFYGARLGRTAP
ncbi:MAG: SUMF1/EgtB/PvdO family nonheme iron enzyme [Candidatus Omnitrophica bacterium]|nr:SUMF1/EgtB/PvdO family nonheme iron enzyme [Candidatus Omnitrophota bacterium]